ncbi:hypothetical protein NL108_009627 [Boleophthalmus pectinirostris]|nr:hypothetical protein NL108_009627 [Boleophthalmus pectinirostris]
MNSSTNSSDSNQLYLCQYVYISWSIVCVLILPLFVSVIVLVILTCRAPRSSSLSHADIFTFNMATLEIIGVIGACFTLLLLVPSTLSLYIAGENLLYMATIGQTLFHLLVCMERYFAVVHPVTYLRLKKNANVIRDSCVAAVWLYSFGMACMYNFKDQVFIAHSVLFVGLATLVLITFFCASVLRVLIRPGPGERGGHRRRMDQSKRRAFYTMVVITVTLLLKFITIFASFRGMKNNMTEENLCLLIVSAQWFNIPSSLVLPVLLLHRHMKERKTKK